MGGTTVKTRKVALGLVVLFSAGAITTATAVGQQRPRTPGIGQTVPPDAGVAVDRNAPVVFATTSVKCGDTIYEVSTGNTAGNCGTAVNESGQTTGATCEDRRGNGASASCQGGCGTSSGSGSCTIKAAN